MKRFISTAVAKKKLTRYCPGKVLTIVAAEVRLSCNIRRSSSSETGVAELASNGDFSSSTAFDPTAAAVAVVHALSVTLMRATVMAHT